MMKKHEGIAVFVVILVSLLVFCDTVFAVSGTCRAPGRSIGINCSGSVSRDGSGNIRSCLLSGNHGFTHMSPGRSIGINCAGNTRISINSRGNIVSCTLSNNHGFTNMYPGRSAGVNCAAGRLASFDDRGNVTCP